MWLLSTRNAFWLDTCSSGRCSLPSKTYWDSYSEESGMMKGESRLILGKLLCGWIKAEFHTDLMAVFAVYCLFSSSLDEKPTRWWLIESQPKNKHVSHPLTVTHISACINTLLWSVCTCLTVFQTWYLPCSCQLWMHYVYTVIGIFGYQISGLE